MAVLEFRSPASGGFFMMPTTFQGICEVLGRGKVVALEGINLNIRSGEFVCLALHTESPPS